jgi:hypothetical protein
LSIKHILSRFIVYYSLCNKTNTGKQHQLSTTSGNIYNHNQYTCCAKDGKQCSVLLFNLMQLSNISFHNIVSLINKVMNTVSCTSQSDVHLGFSKYSWFSSNTISDWHGLTVMLLNLTLTSVKKKKNVLVLCICFRLYIIRVRVMVLNTTLTIPGVPNSVGG